MFENINQVAIHYILCYILGGFKRQNYEYRKLIK